MCPLFPAEAGIQAFSAMAFYVYILASGRNGTLYIGHTDDLSRRALEHKEGAYPGFTRKYAVTTLVFWEE